jgi:NAD(P)-dependent dehydrogenase (short-subunit alcohol dehydrogenase family)
MAGLTTTWSGADGDVVLSYGTHPMSPLSLEDVRHFTQFLFAAAEDRTLLLHWPEQDREAFLEAVGRVANPDHSIERRLAKATRKQRAKDKRARDKAARDTTGIRDARRSPVFVAPAPLLASGVEHPERLLENPRHCYVCKDEYRRVHHFYDALCWDCGEFNYAKRFQQADLSGQVVLITGARVKIGYQASLMLLRNGATVIATTRFPNDATARYLREPDFLQWGQRLHVHGLDLRHSPSVELFARHLAATHSRLDAIINNAAQTVRRPPGWYRHLLEGELKPSSTLPGPAQQLLQGHERVLEVVGHRAHSGLATSWKNHDPALGLHSSAALSLVPYEQDETQGIEQLYPAGRLDADQQQVDLRAVNSWRLTLADVATAEMLEVHLVNAVAPFILNGKLKPLMLQDRSQPGHIVNVSAMEGIFSRGTKTDKHPHTNMAKAALNMMTLTSAPDYAKSHIYMNAVDTGWVTDEDPAHHAERKVTELDFQPPLDIVDGAARIVDPLFEARRSGHLGFGHFLKDYHPADW